MLGFEMKQTLKAGGRVYGTAIGSIGNPRQLEWYLNMGIDFVFLDNEHNPLDRSATAYASTVYAQAGIAPLVRIPRPDLHMASMVLDGGAQGVIVPYVESPDEVLEVVGALRYRPIKGKALKTLVGGGDFPSADVKEYIQERNKNAFYVIMIESAEGISRLDEILGASVVDAVFIGPHDLSISLGVPERYDDPVFEEAASEVLSKCRSGGVGFGIHLNSPELHRRWMERGENIVIFSSDTFGAFTYIGENISRLREVKGKL